MKTLNPWWGYRKTQGIKVGEISWLEAVENIMVINTILVLIFSMDGRAGLTDQLHPESHILAQVEQLVNVSAQSQHPSAHCTLRSDLLQPMTANKRHLNLKFVLWQSIERKVASQKSNYSTFATTHGYWLQFTSNKALQFTNHLCFAVWGRLWCPAVSERKSCLFTRIKQSE